MVYKKIEYREFNSLEEIVRWEELNLDKKYKAIRGDLIYSHDPTAQAILQYSGFLYRPLNYYGRISSNAIIRCGNKKYIKYITDLVEFMYDFPIPENIVTYRFIHRKDFSQLRIAARQEYGLVKGCLTNIISVLASTIRAQQKGTGFDFSFEKRFLKQGLTKWKFFIKRTSIVREKPHVVCCGFCFLHKVHSCPT